MKSRGWSARVLFNIHFYCISVSSNPQRGSCGNPAGKEAQVNSFICFNLFWPRNQPRQTQVLLDAVYLLTYGCIINPSINLPPRPYQSVGTQLKKEKFYYERYFIAAGAFPIPSTDQLLLNMMVRQRIIKLYLFVKRYPAGRKRRPFSSNRIFVK